MRCKFRNKILTFFEQLSNAASRSRIGNERLLSIIKIIFRASYSESWKGNKKMSLNSLNLRIHF